MFAALAGLAEVNRQEYIDRANLEPVIRGFGGSTMNQMLVNGAKQAASVLSKYTSTLTYDRLAANELLDKIEVWQAAHSEQISAYIRSGATTVPQQIGLAFDPQTAARFILASFSQAVQGLPAWSGTAVSDAVRTDPTLTESKAQADAQARLITFASIIRLDQQGQLESYFRPGLSGLGLEPVSTTTVVVAVVVTALVCLTCIAFKLIDIEETNAWVEKRCKQSPDKCDETIEKVILGKIEKEKQGGVSFLPSAKDLGLGDIGKYLGIGVLAYIGVKYVVPAAISAASKKPESAT